MFNFSIKAKAMSGTTILVPETVYKIQAESLADVKTKIATLLNLTTGNTVEITSIGYIQEVLVNEE